MGATLERCSRLDFHSRTSIRPLFALMTGKLLLAPALQNRAFNNVERAFWLWRMKGLRRLSESLLILQELVLAAAGFIAAMSVSGDWL
jgi:hypothetical protein